MGYWNSPLCVTCEHFVKIQLSKVVVENVESPDVDCQCKKHAIHLPIRDTKQQLICADWSDYRGSTAVNEKWQETCKRRMKPKVLYSYSDDYSFDLVAFAEMAVLTSIAPKG